MTGSSPVWSTICFIGPREGTPASEAGDVGSSPAWNKSYNWSFERCFFIIVLCEFGPKLELQNKVIRLYIIQKYKWQVYSPGVIGGPHRVS